ncbi:MAG: response regulator transcription factor [Ruminococcus sp.]
MRILIAEDDQKLLKSLIYIFEHNKFSVDGVDSGSEAYAYAMSGEYDGLVLDIMMPGLDGIQVIKMLREKNITTPALFLTARTEVDQKIEGLDAGADDYLSKPFSPQELLARVRAMLRRKDNYVPEMLKLGDAFLNRSTYELGYKNRICSLSGKEYQIMEMLMEKPSVFIPTEQFITHIWGWNAEVDTSVIWVHISNIRKKMEKIRAPLQIRFMRNAGYILEERSEVNP